jgi:hypothetical protein
MKLIERMAPRWPLMLAIAFSVYSVILLWNIFESQSQLRASRQERVLADTQRRATEIGDYIAQHVIEVKDLAEIPELDTYSSTATSACRCNTDWRPACQGSTNDSSGLSPSETATAIPSIYGSPCKTTPARCCPTSARAISWATSLASCPGR